MFTAPLCQMPQRKNQPLPESVFVFLIALPHLPGLGTGDARDQQVGRRHAPTFPTELNFPLPLSTFFTIRTAG